MHRDNPMGTDGFEFVEFSSQDSQSLAQAFVRLGFTHVASHKSKAVELYQQGHVRFILNAEPHGQAFSHAQTHGTAACAMAFRVRDAKQALDRALSLGAEVFNSPIADGERHIPAIVGIGGSVLYFVDDYADPTNYQRDFNFHVDASAAPFGLGLITIDHLTHNVFRGNMDHWADFYTRIFNFEQIRFFDIQGQHTGLVSRAMASPCGKIKIPLNESTDDHSQIEEFLQEFKGEGIQHIALSTDNIYNSVEEMRQREVSFLTVPDTYYEMITQRFPWQNEDLTRLQANQILIDGGDSVDDGILLQIFTENMFGPQFFEIIQRKGNDGFGEGNFQALFDAIERDQIRRGVL